MGKTRHFKGNTDRDDEGLEQIKSFINRKKKKHKE